MELARSLMLLLFILGILNTGWGQSDIVTLDPEIFVASEGSARVNYTCSTAGSDRVSSSIVILVEGLQPTDEVKRVRGIETVGINSTAGLLSIEPIVTNDNTGLSCQAVFGANAIFTDTVYFRVQGVLSPPTQLQIETSPLANNFQRVTWTPPFTLDITGVDPDITGYEVCFYFIQSSNCSTTQELYFDFLNIDLPLVCLVSAVNVVGESNTTDISRPACSQSLSSGLGVMVGSDQVQVVVTALGTMHSFTVRIQQPPEVVCYDAYRLDVNIADSESPVLSVGPLLPILIDPSIQELELEAVEGLPTNLPFSLQITAVNREIAFNSRVTFTTYDVQAVTLAPQAEGLRVGCTFMERSIATGCELTLCRREQGGGAGEDSFVMCRNITLQRVAPSTLVEIEALGTYAITQVVEVESDGERRIIDVDYIQGSLEASLTIPTMLTISTGDVGSLSTQAAPALGIIVGSAAGGLAIILLGLVIVIVIIYLWKRKGKHEKVQSNGSWSGRNNMVTGNVAGQREVASWTDSIIKETDEGPVVMVTKVNMMDPEPATKPPGHCPTSPFYTDVMHGSTTPLGPETSPAPYLPPKKGSKHNSVISTLSEPSSINPDSGGPLQNLSQEEIREIHFTSPSQGRSKEWLGRANTQMSQESLISRGSQFSVSGAHLTYAEIEHHNKRKEQNATPSDKNNVLYSEIKIPPILPQKKSLKGRRPASNASSSLSVDMDSTHSGLGYRV